MGFGTMTAMLIIGLMAGLMIISAGCISSGKAESAPAAAPSAPVAASDEAVTVRLSFENGNTYTPAEIRVKPGTKLRIEGDPATLVGGMDTVVVDGYGVSKKIFEGDNVLEFVADKPGAFAIHCANQMGNGRLVVG